MSELSAEGIECPDICPFRIDADLREKMLIISSFREEIEVLKYDPRDDNDLLARNIAHRMMSSPHIESMTYDRAVKVGEDRSGSNLYIMELVQLTIENVEVMSSMELLDILGKILVNTISGIRFIQTSLKSRCLQNQKSWIALDRHLAVYMKYTPVNKRFQ